MRVSFDTRQIRRLIVDLDKQPIKSSKRFQKVVRDAAGATVVLWKQNARDTAGDHGKRYPRAIGYDIVGADRMTAEIGPDVSRPQGGMSFEYGSRNQPPHLDGNRAADDVFRVLPKRALDAAELDL